MGVGTLPLRCWAGNPIGQMGMQLVSSQTIPVYVQGGSVQANLSQGGISTLAELIDVENQRRDAFNTAI